MDRNHRLGAALLGITEVASREGGVDRNLLIALRRPDRRVASREGGVDRNSLVAIRMSGSISRLPRGGRGSQHPEQANDTNATDVASREGGVDRNSRGLVEGEGSGGRLPRGGRGSQHMNNAQHTTARRSPPARGAWIATFPSHLTPSIYPVASREGGVDRNASRSLAASGAGSRLPRGGRGSQPVPGLRPEALSGRLPRGGRGSQPLRRHRYPALGGRLPRGGRGSQLPAPRPQLHRTLVASREGGVDRNS